MLHVCAVNYKKNIPLFPQIRFGEGRNSADLTPTFAGQRVCFRKTNVRLTTRTKTYLKYYPKWSLRRVGTRDLTPTFPRQRGYFRYVWLTIKLKNQLMAKVCDPKGNKRLKATLLQFYLKDTKIYEVHTHICSIEATHQVKMHFQTSIAVTIINQIKAYINSIGTLIHEINLRQNSKCPFS